MFSHLKKQWRTFHRAKPGHRFRDFHEGRGADGNGRKWWARVLVWIAGLACIVLGGFFAIFPGPASIFVIPGAILIASESAFFAGIMDWIDVRLAPLIAWLGRRWRRLSKGAQLAIKIVTICSSVTMMAVGIFLTMR